MKRGEAHNVHDFATSTKKRKQACALSKSVILNTRIRPSISESISAIQRETGMAIGISRREYRPLAHGPSTPSQNKQKFLVLMRLGASQPETPLSHHHRAFPNHSKLFSDALMWNSTPERSSNAKAEINTSGKTSLQAEWAVRE
ncbi:predicted protein [Histoplasma capsulatum var. duboisii H88]|uniref:Predicted protein n=1 Tax=Ajellomyces capsulatus (strain H88) TaxID=544711 RepID=F0UQ27_AJEC8|nr:predicted protein [Histoplasma capsulatum var. duboisii H88]